MYALFAVLLMFVGVMTSCDKLMDEPVVSSKVGKLDASEDYLSSRNTLITRGFTTAPANPQEGFLNDTYLFTMYATPASEYDIPGRDFYVRFKAPNTEVVYVKMGRVGVYQNNLVLKLERNLKQAGIYSFEYGYKDNNGAFTSASSAYSISVLYHDIPVNDDYPWSGDSSNQTDDWGYFKRYCTSWTAWKVSQMWGVDFHRNLHSAQNWKSGLSNLGYKCDLSPRVGDIAWWRSNHVAFVNRVIDYNTVEITEYNNPVVNKPLKYHTRILYRNGGTGHKFPDSFIHVQTKRL